MLIVFSAILKLAEPQFVGALSFQKGKAIHQFLISRKEDLLKNTGVVLYVGISVGLRDLLQTVKTFGKGREHEAVLRGRKNLVAGGQNPFQLFIGHEKPSCSFLIFIL